MRRSRIITVATLALIGACSGEAPSTPEPPPPPGPLVVPSLAEVEASLAPLGFDDFIEQSFLHLVRRSPESALAWQLQAELPDNPGRLDDLSDDFAIETHEVVSTIRARLEAFELAALSEPQRLTAEVYAWYLDDLARAFAYRDHVYQATHLINGDPFTTELFFTELHPLEGEADARAYINRLWGVDDKFAQLGAELERRAALGLAPPAMMINWVLGALEAVASAPPHRTPYYGALSRALYQLADMPPSTRNALLAEADAAVRDGVIPAYAELQDVLRRIRSGAPTAIGVGARPDGLAYYAEALRHHTTTTSTADELHALGLRELERIHAELRRRFDALGYPRGEALAETFARVAADGGLVAGKDVVKTYTDIIEATYPRLAAAFDLAPSTPVVVIGGSSGGYYLSPSLDGRRPGAFYAVAGGGAQPRFAMPTLAYHETVPGHHHQIGIAQDLDLPFFRRVINFNAYTEGWGLYAERLAGDLGWYDDDPYGDLGRLQAEAFRAVRLVVDTGLHTRGWSFERARDFFVDNTGLDSRAIGADGQIARYTAWPGQATAYSVGMLELLALRAQAQAALRDRFDLVAFHRVVLTTGAVPLPILRARVERWIDAER